MTEVDWVGFRGGSSRVFRELIDQHSSRLLAVIRVYARDEDDASDLLQDVWLRIYTQRQSCRSDESLLGWMLTITRNVCLAAGRSARARAVREGAYADLGDTSFSDSDEVDIHEILAALPSRQRDTVILRIIEGRSTRETAQLLGCAEGTVKALLHQALTGLRRNMRSTDESTS